MVRYTIHLSGESSVSLEAAKVNTGQNWLWFSDAANHLIGLYYWRNILGFTVEDSASDQVITDRVPMDMGMIRPEEYSRSTLFELEELERRRKERKRQDKEKKA
jgi:hypothetical protein